MRYLTYILFIIILSSCNVEYYTIEDSKMIKEARIIEVKKFRAKRIQKKLERKGFKKPQYIYGQMELYFEHIDSTIRFRPNEIKQLKK